MIQKACLLLVIGTALSSNALAYAADTCLGLSKVISGPVKSASLVITSGVCNPEAICSGWSCPSNRYELALPTDTAKREVRLLSGADQDTGVLTLWINETDLCAINRLASGDCLTLRRREPPKEQ